VKSAVRKAAYFGLGATLAIGLLHLPAAAPVLRAISPSAVCPLTRGTAAQIDRAHEVGAAALRSATATPAPARPALGFRLDAPVDIATWAKARGVTCASVGGNETLQRCTDVPADDGSRIDEVTFELRSTGELVNVQTMRRGLSPETASALAARLEDRAARELGAPTTLGGEATAAHFAHGNLATFIAEHAFHDYRATISATSFGERGTMVREQYLSVL